ncbi:MAG: endonuclease/exonuclease/phosphatase family protein [Gemmatimonadaceae bacterium]
MQQALRRWTVNAWPFHRGERSTRVKLLALAVWGFLASVIATATVMWTLGDRTATGTVLLFAGRWIYLPPLAFLFVLARRLRRALIGPLVVAAVVIVGPIMGLEIGWRRLLPDPAGTRIRVVTLNTGNNTRLATELPRLLAQWNADIVALQECGPAVHLAVKALSGWHVHAAQPSCLISRYPISVAQVMDRSSLERVRADAVMAIGGAGYVVRYVLDTPAGPVGFTNLHLETVRKGLESFLEGTFDFQRLRENSELRQIESERARAWVDGGMVPVIVAGDFNTARESRNFREYWGDLRNAYSMVGMGFGATKFNGWIRARIDHVLYGQGLRAVRAFVGPDAWSDHRPLIVDLVRLARI